jgi:transposase
MKTPARIWLNGSDRSRLERVAKDRNSPQKHVWRARIVLLSAKGLGTMAITRLTGKSKPTVWRWQARYLEEGVDGLFRDKSRPPGRAPLSAAIIRRVVELTHKPPPFEETHWSARAMACATGISVSSVQRIWKAHGLKPHKPKTSPPDDF